MAEKRERCIEYKSDSIHCSIRLATINECVYHYYKRTKYKGGALKMTSEQIDKIIELYSSGLSANQTANRLGITKPTVLRYARIHKINRTEEAGRGSYYTDKRRQPKPKTSEQIAGRLLLMTAEYKEFRKRMFKRDLWTCQKCGYKGSKIELDHILPRRLYPELGMSEDNVRTLCKECHKLTDSYGGKALKLTRGELL